MNDAERYQRDFDEIMRETEERAKYARHLHGVESLEELFAAAAQVGIDHRSALEIIGLDPTDAKAGFRALIAEVGRRAGIDLPLPTSN